ncbi:MAG: response regulator [Magnetococcales bacterium]|nr:response regulator [Magnetococcales bacterium]
MRKLLVVDDVPSNLKLIAGMLYSHYNICISSKGEEAIKIAISEKPDLIILDIVMPDMDGLDIYLSLKEDSLTRNIPVLFYTAKAITKEIEKELIDGQAYYITKPATKTDLLAMINSII